MKDVRIDHERLQHDRPQENHHRPEVDQDDRKRRPLREFQCRLLHCHGWLSGGRRVEFVSPPLDPAQVSPFVPGFDHQVVWGLAGPDEHGIGHIGVE